MPRVVSAAAAFEQMHLHHRNRTMTAAMCCEVFGLSYERVFNLSGGLDRPVVIIDRFSGKFVAFSFTEYPDGFYSEGTWSSKYGWASRYTNRPKGAFIPHPERGLEYVYGEIDVLVELFGLSEAVHNVLAPAHGVECIIFLAPTDSWGGGVVEA